MTKYLLTFVLLFGLSHYSHAQDGELSTETTTTTEAVTEIPKPEATAEVPKEDVQEEKELERIEVTGSYIKRTVKEGSPSPVKTVTNTDMQETGNYSFSDTIKESAIGSTGDFGSSISFHGQGAGNNLVLLNGLRLPKTAGGDFVDVDFIPSSAVERVEILKDGASALYGSEALSGVVNIMTKKRYDGASFMIRQSVPEIGVGMESNLVGTYGKTWRRGSVIVVGQYRGSQAVQYSDTQYGMVDVRGAGSLAGAPGNLFAKSADKDDPNSAFRAGDCPPDRIDEFGQCRYNYYNTTVLQPEKHFYNLLVGTELDLGKKLKLENVMLYTRRDWTLETSPMYWQFEDQSAGGGKDYSLKPEVVQKWSDHLTNSKTKKASQANDFDNKKFGLQLSADEELGRRISTRNVDNFVTQFKLGKIKKDWDWELSAGYGITFFRDTLESGNANKEILYKMMNEGRYNPFKPSGQKDDLSEAMIETWYQHTSDVINTKAITTGNIVNINERPLYMALGAEGQRQSFSFENDELSKLGVPLTGAASDQSGTRTVGSAFIEFSHNPIEALQIQLAGRFDQYSDFGSTANPKLGLTYQLSKNSLVRSSYGTGFKAPDLLSVYQGDLTRVARIRDEVICQTNKNDPNCNNLYSVTSHGDKDLQPELGEHLNFGFQIQPTKKWTFAIDHWRAKGRQALQDINLDALTRAEATYGKEAVEKSLGLTIDRDPNTNVIRSIRHPLLTNTGSYEVNGIDFEIGFRSLINPMGLGAYNLAIKLDHSHTLANQYQEFFFTPTMNRLDLQWKNVFTFSLAKGNHLGKWRVRTYAAQDKNTSLRDIGDGSIPTYSEHDLHYEYYAAWDGVFTFGIKNIFDLTIANEFNRGTPGFALPATSTLLGRTFYASYEHTF